jgi:C-terminal processing protease CtpA/Prc
MLFSPLYAFVQTTNCRTYVRTQGGNDGNIPSLAGVGVVFRAANGGGDLHVVAVAPDGPAKASGLNPKP